LPEDLRQLLERVRSGDPPAAALLVERFARSAQRLARALTGDHHLAEEAVQEAFVAALGRLSELRSPEAFPAWFRQVVRTRCNHLMRRRRERTGLDLPDSPAAAPSPLESLEQDELRARVRAAVRRLPPAERQAVECFYLEERGLGGVVEVLNLPRGTVARRLHDARRRLRSLLLGPAAMAGGRPRSDDKPRPPL
jgi:RNA polymerase sigma factor (sigma-70 family)